MKLTIDVEVGDVKQLEKLLKYMQDSLNKDPSAIELSNINDRFIGGHIKVNSTGVFAPFIVIDDETSEVVGYHYDEKSAKLQQYNERSAFVYYKEKV